MNKKFNYVVWQHSENITSGDVGYTIGDANLYDIAQHKGQKFHGFFETIDECETYIDRQFEILKEIEEIA